MSRILCFALLLATALPVALIIGQTEPRDKPDRNEVEVRFLDGSKVRMTVLQESLDVTTRYGKLTIPVTDIRNIEFGLHLPDEVAKQVETAVQRLGNNAHADREAASRELVQLGHQAYPAVQGAVKSKDPEVSRRAEEVVKRIRDKVPTPLLRLDANDRIETVMFPIVGRISSGTLKARSAYFGEKEIRISDLLAVHFNNARGTSEFTVDAAKYGSPTSQWLNTGVEVDADTDLNITASGQVDLRDDGTGRFVTGPAGFSRAGGFGGMQKAMAGGPAGIGGPGMGGVNVAGGALIGRIGESGDAFYVGENFKGKPGLRGKLYLHIVPSPWGMNSVGSYKVKVNLGGLP